MLAWSDVVAGVPCARAPSRPLSFRHHCRMDVYLVPISPTRQHLYCEVSPSPVTDGDEKSTSWLERVKARFRRAVDEGEAAQYGELDDREHGRLRRFISRKLAETVTEQRLLWHLRHETVATLHHQDSIAGSRALAIARAEFEADYGRHRRWLIINGLLTAITGPLLFFVPGPNIVSWYFSFRAIGHFFSMRGARRALSGVDWTASPSPHLTSVGAALTLPPDVRGPRLAAAGDALGLHRLAAFVERVADRSA
jgi:hypothetical protein